VPVHETFQGQTVWNGDVEVFKVNHPEADAAYAWSTSEGKFTAVPGIPPAADPLKAVHVSICGGREEMEAINIAGEKAKFRRQFNENQWTELIANQRFIAAWASDDMVKAGEIAVVVFYGNATNSDGVADQMVRQAVAEYRKSHPN